MSTGSEGCEIHGFVTINLFKQKKCLLFLLFLLCGDRKQFAYTLHIKPIFTCHCKCYDSKTGLRPEHKELLWNVHSDFVSPSSNMLVLILKDEAKR